MAVERNTNNVVENKFTKPENIRIFGLFLFLKICNFSSKSVPTYVLLESLVDVLVCDDKYINMNKSSVIYNWVVDKNYINAKYPILCCGKCNKSICPPKHW